MLKLQIDNRLLVPVRTTTGCVLAKNEYKYAQAARSLDDSFAASLGILRVQRDELLNGLRVLDPGGWERAASILGSKHTVFTQTRRMAKHEQEHCQQMEAIFR